MLRIVKQCVKELADFPDEVRGDLADAIARLEEGHVLAPPLSKPMPSIGRAVHELRFRDRSGAYRVIYVLAHESDVWLVHAFKKKTQKTPKRNIEVAQQRLREIKK